MGQPVVPDCRWLIITFLDYTELEILAKEPKQAMLLRNLTCEISFSGDK